MNTDKRTAFFISDGTGITSEALGVSLLKRFDSIRFEKEALPYVDSVQKAKEVVERINQRAELDGAEVVQSLRVDVVDAAMAFVGDYHVEEVGRNP